MSKFYDVAVVGAGIAGLTSAALLARAGARVVLCESHDKPGGCTGYFDVPSKWGRFRFPVGATAALGLEERGLHTQIFRELGVTLEAHPIERLRVFLPDVTLDLARDAAQWKRERAKLPGHRAAQELFWRLQEQIADAGWFALERRPFLPLQKPTDLWRNLPLAHPKMMPMLAALPFSVGELMKWLGVDRDRAFCALVNLQLLITVQSLSHRAPLSNGMAGLDLWRHGAWHPVGGIGAIGEKLLEAFGKHGGEVRFETPVQRITRRGGLWHLETENETIRAEHVIANLPSWRLPQLVADFPQRRIEREEATWGAVTVYVGLRDEVVPRDFPIHSQVLGSYARTAPFLDAGAGDDVFLSLSLPDDELSAPRGFRTLNLSTHIHLRDWHDLSPLEYRAQKKQWRDRLLGLAARALPALDDQKLFAITGTPATWRDYTGRAGVGGVRLTRRNANLRARSVRTELPNLYLVGDTTFPGQGTVACALSGLNAARLINPTL